MSLVIIGDFYCLGAEYPFAADVFQNLQADLTSRFGGVTAYSGAPAKGLRAHNKTHQADDIVMLEVMTDDLDEAWWRQLRLRLEIALRQEVIVMRAQEIRNL